MDNRQRSYIAIDLKSFYASVECVARGLDPLDANLVVADSSRTQKTICLAVSPQMKGYGLKGRPRLFEVVQRIREVNIARSCDAPGGKFTGKSYSAQELASHPEMAVDYVVAKPRMAEYLRKSAEIYKVYLRYISPEDIHVYSIDEVFIDVTSYLRSYGVTPHELALRIIRDVLATTGITATAGIGTNMYLCKVAMDIVAKKMAPDKDGVRIAELDEMSYRRMLWEHRPLTDFWRIGRGISRRLEQYGMTTMGDVARCSIDNEGLLYSLFGVNAELLIDHAWGWEPVTMDMVKAYRPENRSMGSGQVLSCAYTAEKARVVALEMAETLSLALFRKGCMTDRIMLGVGYDAASLSDPDIATRYHGRVSTDFYGRRVPYHTHVTGNLTEYTSSTRIIVQAVAELFDGAVNRDLLVRRLTVTALHIEDEQNVYDRDCGTSQLELFVDYDKLKADREEKEQKIKRERSLQQALLRIKDTYGKNAILRGLNYAEGATQRERNFQIGGHKA
ncbi:DNA methylase [Muribaculum sp.]|uniref:Y-family DNA polymerase n=1 Tax=Muribaculum sp. TaxID=1918611 RepID=UPI0023C3E9CB|nr:DNA methylase [Muribaculum sp.]MDE5706346.1 DNA methylase [Muribaculum sp.]